MAWWVNHTRVSVCSTLFGAKHHLVLERLGFKPCIRLACYIPMPVCFVSKMFQTSTHLALHLQDHNKIKISFLSLFWCPSTTKFTKEHPWVCWRVWRVPMVPRQLQIGWASARDAWDVALRLYPRLVRSCGASKNDHGLRKRLNTLHKIINH